MTTTTVNSRIAELNDQLRKTFIGGKVVATQGIQALPATEQAAILHAVQTFSVFNEDNDPYQEHDFGTFKHNGTTVNFKIDYYDVNYEYLSEDPADPKLTRRVLTIMTASEY
jgi:hypothetical protein